jgi:hypothetical protein
MTFQHTEIARFIDNGVLEEDGPLNWHLKHLLFPKRMELLALFTINSLHKFFSFPIAKIGDRIRSMKRFTFATALDLNMGYYQIKLDADAKDYAPLYFPAENVSANVYPWEFKLPLTLIGVHLQYS